jgi:hypothetical protein
MTPLEALDWVKHLATPASIIAGVWVLITSLHRLMKSKANASTVEEIRKYLEHKVEQQEMAVLQQRVGELEAQMQKGNYDIGQALAGLYAVHKRIDEQSALLKSNTETTINIALRVGAQVAPTPAPKKD